jgi:hypothetical protein
MRTSLLTLADAVLTLAAAGQLGDYRAEAAPALEAIARGDVASFAASSNFYAGSLTMRAPFVALAGALGGDRLELYQAGVFACLLGAVALAIVLDAAAQRAGATLLSRMATATTIFAAPLVLRMFYYGHPEEILTAAMAVMAVWAAPKRPLLAGALLGAAAASKPWALVAAGPVLLCARGARLRLLAAATAAGLVALLPFLATDLGRSTQMAASTASTGFLWGPFQLWWPLGVAHHHPVADGAGGTLDVIRWTAPDWVGLVSRALTVGLSLPSAALAYARGRRSRADALLLLALLLHLRCLLDPWNTVYYAIPAALALVAWSVERRDRLPLAATAYAALVWLTFIRLTLIDDRALMFAGYVAWALPVAGLLATQLYRRPRARAPLRLPGALSPARP